MVRRQLSEDDFRGRLLIVAGMSRGGTTFLYHQLPRHPRIVSSAEKELCFFGMNYARDGEWWASRCPAVGEGDVLLDVCGLYFAEYEKAIPRIRQFDDRVKIVLSLRDPSEWIFSLYEHYEYVWGTPPFREFLRGCSWPRDGSEVSLKFGNGRIRETTLAFASAFADQVLICDFNLLRTDPLGLLGRISEHAGLDRFFSDENVDRRKYLERKSKGSRLLREIVRIPGIPAAARMIPPSVRSPIRRMFERGGESSKRSRKRNHYSEDDRRFALEVLAPDVEFYRSLFATDAIVTGAQLIARSLTKAVATGRGATDG